MTTTQLTRYSLFEFFNDDSIVKDSNEEIYYHENEHVVEKFIVDLFEDREKIDPSFYKKRFIVDL